MASVESSRPSLDEANGAPFRESRLIQLQDAIEELQKENRELRNSIGKGPIEDGGGENIEIVMHKSIYVSLDDVRPLLRVNRAAILIFSIGGSFLTAYISQGDLLKILCGVFLIGVAILLDYILLNRKINDFINRKEIRWLNYVPK